MATYLVYWKLDAEQRFAFCADVVANDAREALLVFASQYPNDIICGVMDKQGKWAA